MVSQFKQEHAVPHRSKSRISLQEETPTGTRLPKSSKRLGNLENLSSAFEPAPVRRSESFSFLAQ